MMRVEGDDSRAPSYTRVARAKTGRRRGNDKQSMNKDCSARLGKQQQQRTAARVQTSQPKQPLVPIKGARKVWNTYKIVTTSAISHAIHTITGISVNNLAIKRKFRLNATDSKVAAWWFVIRGEESLLEQLDNSWQQVNLQTKWELKPVFSYASTDENTQLHNSDNSNVVGSEQPEKESIIDNNGQESSAATLQLLDASSCSQPGSFLEPNQCPSQLLSQH